MGILRSPAFSLYVRDIIASPTIRRLHATKGCRGLAYIYLLCNSWLEEHTATLPDDHDQLAEMARMSRQEWDEFWPLIQHQFKSDGNGRLFNPRLYHEFLKQQNRQERGKLGGIAKASANPCANPSANSCPKTKTKTKTNTREQDRYSQKGHTQ